MANLSYSRLPYGRVSTGISSIQAWLRMVDEPSKTSLNRAKRPWPLGLEPVDALADMAR